jgi:hypothetical protein
VLHPPLRPRSAVSDSRHRRPRPPSRLLSPLAPRRRLASKHRRRWQRLSVARRRTLSLRLQRLRRLWVSIFLRLLRAQPLGWQAARRNHLELIISPRLSVPRRALVDRHLRRPDSGRRGSRHRLEALGPRQRCRVNRCLGRRLPDLHHRISALGVVPRRRVLAVLWRPPLLGNNNSRHLRQAGLVSMLQRRRQPRSPLVRTRQLPATYLSYSGEISQRSPLRRPDPPRVASYSRSVAAVESRRREALEVGRLGHCVGPSVERGMLFQKYSVRLPSLPATSPCARYVSSTLVSVQRLFPLSGPPSDILYFFSLHGILFLSCMHFFFREKP